MLCMWQGVWERGDDCPPRELLPGGFCAPADWLSVSNKRLAFLSPRHLASSPDVLEARVKYRKISGCLDLIILGTVIMMMIVIIII